jgi:hypothetical protein
MQSSSYDFRTPSPPGENLVALFLVLGKGVCRRYASFLSSRDFCASGWIENISALCSRLFIGQAGHERSFGRARPALRAAMPALPANTLAAVLEALRIHRNTLRVVKLTGVSQATAWRIAKNNGITLISLAEHMKACRADPAFNAKHLAAVRSDAARRRMKRQQANPKFHKKSIEAARLNLTRLNSDPAFRQASSERLKRLHGDPDYRAKLYAALSAAHRVKRVKRRAKAVEAALHTLTRLDSDPDFRLAASERLSCLRRNGAGHEGILGPLPAGVT